MVDDSKSVRDMVSFTLKKEGYSITVAEDGQEALDKTQTNEFDMIITDLNMPRMNGIELVRSVRENSKYMGKAIIILTTESEESKKVEAKKAGATGWIVKPFNDQQLVKVVQKVLGPGK